MLRHIIQYSWAALPQWQAVERAAIRVQAKGLARYAGQFTWIRKARKKVVPCEGLLGLLWAKAPERFRLLWKSTGANITPECGAAWERGRRSKNGCGVRQAN